MTRRTFLISGASVLALTAIAARLGFRPVAEAAAETFPVIKTDAEWKKLLSPQAYDVLRHEGTEAPGTSALLEEHRDGVFNCAGCAQPVYASKTKFDSGTGWPSFWAAVDGGVGTSEDRSYLMLRTEVHCARCGGHLGHIFDDGPQPTGKRHCINGVALNFAPATA